MNIFGLRGQGVIHACHEHNAENMIAAMEKISRGYLWMAVPQVFHWWCRYCGYRGVEALPKIRAFVRCIVRMEHEGVIEVEWGQVGCEGNNNKTFRWYHEYVNRIRRVRS